MASPRSWIALEIVGNIFYYYIQQMLFIPGTGVIKISFALTLLKIVQDRIEIFALYFIVFAATAITLIPFFWFLLACQPISLNWALGSESCYVNERTSIFNGHGAITAFLDLVLGIVIPAIVLHRLKVRLRVKVIAGAMLSHYLKKLTLNKESNPA
ncbi:hypothetical protein TWF679_007083 [Orbilia oligospora]|uniref:Rhodopsin domain-containing protein n=1 Tax=Orbilia oligospora TaxID=2813651 RepID=A0A8H8VL69_ORBOL|nr:hypothetical protein TWF679_007083 [Orbilia oligospora]